jgi:hypothetical protein
MLECLYLVGHPSLVLWLRIRLEPTRVKELSGAPLQGRLLALPPKTDLAGKTYKGQTVQLITNINKLQP